MSLLIKFIIALYFVCIPYANQDIYVSFKYLSRDYNFLPKIIKSINQEPKSLTLLSTNVIDGNYYLKPYNKIPSIKDSKEMGLDGQSFVHSIRCKMQNSSDNEVFIDLAIPQVVKIIDYRKHYLKQNYYYAFRSKVIKTITKKRNMNSASSRAITLVSKNIAGSEVALKIDGNININGQLIFEEKDQLAINKNQNKTWDLDIEQSQRFNIEGTIGDRVSIKAHQDSEADFSFENDLNITYTGKKNNVLKKLEAGNIGLHLPSSQFVNVGSSRSEGLFGIKMIHQLGPLAIQSILSREQVKKSSIKSNELQSSGEIDVYNYIRDKYYFINKYFKAQYYPLTNENRHVILADSDGAYLYTISDHEVWKVLPYQDDNNQGEVVSGVGRVNPFISTDDDIEGDWIKLTEKTSAESSGDYTINRELGTLEFYNTRSSDIIAISYKIGKKYPSEVGYINYDESNDSEINQVISRFSNMDDNLEFDEIIDNGTSLRKDCGVGDCSIVMQLIKSTNKTSDPSSPTWDLMFKNVYSVGAPGVKAKDIDLKLIYIGGNNPEQTHSEISNKSFLEIFGLDRFSNDNVSTPGTDGKIDQLSGSKDVILNSRTGELFFPTYLPFAFDSLGRVNSSNNLPIIFQDISYWGPNPGAITLSCDDGSESLCEQEGAPCGSDEQGECIMEPPYYIEDLEAYLVRLNDSDNNFSDTDDDGPAMYYDLINSGDIISENQFQIQMSGSNTQRSNKYNLGFMIVPNSEEVRLNGTKLIKDVDYTIIPEMGQLTITHPLALDPTSIIEISYEENELISFDQKFLAGIHMKLNFLDNDYISGGAYYYNQTMVDDKVEIGYEPMRNFLWNINGKFDRDINFLTTLTDKIPFIEASQKSSFSIEGELARVYPNPNPLGKAFLDDFESSKQTTSPSMLQNKWKQASPPLIFSQVSQEIYETSGEESPYTYEGYSITHYLEAQFGEQNDDGTTTCNSDIDICFTVKDSSLYYQSENVINAFQLSINQSCQTNLDVILDGGFLDSLDVDQTFTTLGATNVIIPSNTSSQILLTFDTESIEDCFNIGENDYFYNYIGSTNTTNPLVDNPLDNQYQSTFISTELKLKDREEMYWYNPYLEINTNQIWPNIETSNQARNSKTQTLWIGTNSQWGSNDWNGISTAFYPGDYNQEKSKYIDLWLNTDQIEDDNFKLHIDLGYISEDANGNNYLDTEDYPSQGNRGNGYLEEGEDTGYDGCYDEYEDGLGGCLSELTFTEACGFNYSEDWEYEAYLNLIPNINYNLCNQLPLDDNGNHIDPNKDNFFFELVADCENQIDLEPYCDYTKINRSEGNGIAQGYLYPDTEDLDNDFMIDSKNDYFTYDLNLSSDLNIIEESENGWKLFRVNLADFDRVLPDLHSTVGWDEIKTMRLWMKGSGSGDINKLGIARVEIVGSQWEELGEAYLDSLNNSSAYIVSPDFSISVVNTDENLNYSSPGDVEGEYNELNQIREKEQSLVLNFSDSGIPPDKAVAIKKSLNYMTSANKDNFFIYDSLKMYVNAQPQNLETWNETADSDSVDFIFRLVQESVLNGVEYYEIRQTLLKGWEEKNHIDINLDLLTQVKAEMVYPDSLIDTGSDTCFDDYEDGFGGCLESVNLEYIEGTDPNNDNWSEQNLLGTQNNQELDEDETYIEHPLSNDGVYTEAGNGYNELDQTYSWDSNIKSICHHCTKLTVKGNPAINRIDYIMVAVGNNTSNQIKGEVYINELRFTGVRKDQGQAFRLSSALNFSDLLSLESQYKREDADFHRLQERLGDKFTTELFTFKSTFDAHKFLPSEWGVKVPIFINYQLQNQTPKYNPDRPDVLTYGPEEASDDIKTINESISLSTSYSKSTRSKNWFSRITLDNININYSIINSSNSTDKILSDLSQNQDLGLNYSYNFSKDNFIVPFKEELWLYKFITNIPILKFAIRPFFDKISKTKVYYSPEKISTNLSISESDKSKTMRTLVEENSYSLDMNRSLSITHKTFSNLKTTFQLNIGSDLYYNMDKNNWSKLDLIENLNPGLVENYSQVFSNTYAPEVFYWLKPTFKFNPSYTWSLGDPNDEVLTSSIKNTTNFETSFNIIPKDLVEVFYKPSSGNSSKKKGRGRGSRSSNSNRKDPLLKNVKNSFIKSLLDNTHKIVTKFSKVQFRYDYSGSHSHNHILSNQNIDYMFRLGLSESPSTLIYSSEEGKSGGFSHSYSYDYKITIPSISVINSISLTSLEFKVDSSKSISSSGVPTSSKSVSYLPLGLYGNKGIYLPSWNLSWSGLEKIEIISKHFKSFKFSHSYKGQKHSSYQDNSLKNNDYSLIFSPLLKLNVRTKAKNPINFEIGSSYKLDIYSEGLTIEHDMKTDIYNKIEYSRSKGLYIPLFFFRDLDLNNSVSFSINTDFELSQKMVAYERIEEFQDNNKTEGLTKVTFMPKVSYQFSQWVTGNIFYKHIITNNISTGKRKERDFGFNVTIQIRG